MGEKCAVCGMKCGIGSVKTNNGENVCSICVEKCGGKKNSKIKETSILELKDIVREYNRKALEAKNTSTKSETIVQSENIEPEINSTEPANSNTVNNNALNTKAPINTSKKGFGCFNIIAVLIFIVIVSNLIGAIGGTPDNDNSSSTASQSITYTTYDVSDLMDDLDSNSLKASDKYKDQYVRLTGQLNVIDSSGKYISITPTGEEYAITGVLCNINSEDQKKAIADMSIGDKIVVKGKISDVGEVLGYTLDMDEVSKR